MVAFLRRRLGGGGGGGGGVGAAGAGEGVRGKGKGKAKEEKGKGKAKEEKGKGKEVEEEGKGEGGGASVSVFCYVNNVFAPGLDEGVGALWRVSASFSFLFFSFSGTRLFSCYSTLFPVYLFSLSFHLFFFLALLL